MSEPTQTCQVCGDVEIVRHDGRGFPPDIAKRRLARRCKEAGHVSDPKYRAGFLFAPREFTDEQIENGVLKALEKQDVEVVPSLLKLLALQNPRRADELRQTLLVGLRIASAGTLSPGACLSEDEK